MEKLRFLGVCEAEAMRQDSERAVTATIDNHIAEMVKQHALAVESLTEQQFVEALRQAIRCGDFVREVSIHNGGQSVIYAPYNEWKRQSMTIKSLEAELQVIKDYQPETSPQVDTVKDDIIARLREIAEERRRQVYQLQRELQSVKDHIAGCLL